MDNTPAAEAAKSTFLAILTDQIKPSPYQARKDFDEEGLKKLADSIAQEGLQQPITVRKVGDAYELIAGERRLRATKLLGKPTIDAHVVEVASEASAAAKGLIENLLRENLNPIEEAEGYQKLLDLKDEQWNQAKIARATGKGENRISEALSFLRLPEEVKELFRCRKLSWGHGVELARLNSPKSKKRLAQKLVQKGLNVMQTRALVDKKLGKTTETGKRDRDRDGADSENQGVKFVLEGKKLSFHGAITLEPGQDPTELLTQTIQAAFAAWATGKSQTADYASKADEALTPEEAMRLVAEGDKNLQ